MKLYILHYRPLERDMKWDSILDRQLPYF